MSFDIPYPKIDLDDTQLERLFTIIPVLLVVLAGAAALWLYFSVSSLLPQAETVVDLPDLRSKASVVRDRNGVPTIMAASQEDAALILGYVMAQDRLWQMDYLRRSGEGRLAEILGKQCIVRDELARTVIQPRELADELSHLDPSQSIWLDRFIQGVNSFISNHEGKYPVEFSLLDYKPQPFSRKDVNSIIVAVAWDSSMAARLDPLINRIAGRFGEVAVNEILPLDTMAPKPVIPSDLKGWEPRGLLFDQVSVNPQPGTTNGFQGGCAWAVCPDRSRSGKAMVCNVVYQELSAPPFWYRARLSAGDFHLSGAFIPGVPVAISGSNQLISWGSVHLPVDDVDLYIEHVDSEAELRYFRPDGWRKCERLEEKFILSGGSTIKKTLLRTDTGPLVSDVDRGRAIAMRWTGQGGTGLFQSMFQINRSANGSDLRAALARLGAPAFQVVWADSSGSVGMQIAGKIPVRPDASDGIIALPGWTGVHGWHGFIPFQELPAMRNPQEGYLVAADGKQGEMNYPFLLGAYGEEDARRSRISMLLNETSLHDRESLSRIPLDIYSPYAAEMVPVILCELERENDYSALETKALNILKEWNLMMDRDSAGAALFSLWHKSFLENLLLDKLGNTFFRELAGHSQLLGFLARKKLLDGQGSGGKDIETSRLIRNSFRAAISLGRKLMGDEPANWRWGSIHKVLFQHPLAAQSSLLEALFDVGPISVEGSWDTLRLSDWSPAAAFVETRGCTLTQLVEMSSTPILMSSVPLGNSAHFFSSHYKNGISGWKMGRLSLYRVVPEDISYSAPNTVLFQRAGSQSSENN